MILLIASIPLELEIKDTTDIATSVSCIDLHLEIDSEDRLRKDLYDKRDDSNFCELSIYNVATFQQHLHMEYISVR